MYNTIKLEKGLYNIASKSFTEVLSELDPDENYKGSDLENLDAFERQLKRFDIKLCGEKSDKVEKFFNTTESAVLFPEFVRRAIKQGMEEASILPYIIAATTKTNTVDYRGITVSSPENTYSPVLEGTDIPVTFVKLASETTTLSKVGRKISTSYEAIRQQRLDLFAVTLKKVGAELSSVINKYAVNKLTEFSSAAFLTGDTFNYSELVNFWSLFENYNVTTMLVNPVLMAKILQFPEMESCKGDYMSRGIIKTPFGADLVKSSCVSDTQVIALDKNCALEFIQGSDVVVDFDKLISTQMEDITFTVTIGYSAIVPEAAKTLITQTV